MRRGVAWSLVVVLLAACTGDEGPRIETAEVTAAEVVETVAAAAELQPAAEATASSPAAGEVAQLLVADGDEVAEGDQLLVLASEQVEAQVEQAEAAVAATDELLAAADAAGDAGAFDLAPLFGGFRAQLDAVFPPVLDGLRTQVRALEADDGSQALAALAEDGLLGADADDLLAGFRVELPVALPDGLPSGVAEQVTDAVQAAADEAADAAGSALATARGAVTRIEDLAVSAAREATAARERQLTAARQALADAERSYADARNALVTAEQELAASTAQATGGQVAGQLAAIDAQREQASLALDAARARAEGLVVEAPTSGVVELARGGAGAGAGLLDGLGGLDLGGLGGDVDALDLEADDPGGGLEPDALPDGAAGGDPADAGPVAEGTEVAAGQPLATVYDLSSFTALAAVDEIDVVHVEVGQAVTVLVDAFPDAELTGRVEHIAIAPQRQAAGGTVFPVTVELTDVPDDVSLRVGLTASVEIEVQRVEADTAVPTSALLRRGGGEVVYVARDGVADAVEVRVLAVGDEAAAVEAVDGSLRAGDEVVTVGVELVEDGTELPG